MLVGFLIILAIVAIALYVSLMMRFVPGFADQRLGKLEPLPEKLGEWKPDESQDALAATARGEIREIRYLFDPDAGLLSSGRLTLQVRYRDEVSNAIVRTEPDANIRRKRTRA